MSITDFLSPVVAAGRRGRWCCLRSSLVLLEILMLAGPGPLAARQPQIRLPRRQESRDCR